MQYAIGIAFLIGGVFYIAFGSSRSFVLALLFLLTAHTGGSILWVFSTVLLQREVEDKFRGRVFAAELALLTLTMAASNYLTGEMLDRFGFSPRTVTIAIGTFFLMPGVVWLLTEKWWNRDQKGELGVRDQLGAQARAEDTECRAGTFLRYRACYSRIDGRAQ